MCENSCLNRASHLSKRNTWLSEFAKNITSQWGEDGIILKALEIIRNCDKWCVEFGSWDGQHFSNTYNLIKNKEYSAVLIESDTLRFQDLLKTHEGNDKVIPKNDFVGFSKDNCLDTILKTTEIPSDFDLLSVDIDGNDYHVWEAVHEYRAKVVIIEYNPTIPVEVEFVQPRDMNVNQGSSLLSINKLAKKKGYELVATTLTNAVFVDAKYFNLFGIKDNSSEAMWTDRSLITHMFCGYDGTVFIRGCCKLPWHRISYKESKMQQLPKFLREYNYSPLKRKIAHYYRKLR
jgi:hypothetical protein